MKPTLTLLTILLLTPLAALHAADTVSRIEGGESIPTRHGWRMGWRRR